MFTTKYHGSISIILIISLLFQNGICQTGQFGQQSESSSGPVFMDPLRRALGLWGRLLNRMSQNTPPTDDQLHLKGAASELERAFSRHSGHKLPIESAGPVSNSVVDGGGDGDIEWEDSPKNSPSGGFGGGFGSAKSPTGGFGGGTGATQFSAGGSAGPSFGPMPLNSPSPSLTGTASLSGGEVNGADKIINQEKLYELLPRLNPKMTTTTSDPPTTTTIPSIPSTTSEPTSPTTITSTVLTSTTTVELSTSTTASIQKESSRPKRKKSEKRRRKKQRFMDTSTVSTKVTVIPETVITTDPTVTSSPETITQTTTVKEEFKLPVDKTTKVWSMPNAVLKVRMSTLADEKVGEEKPSQSNETSILKKLESETAELIAEIESALKSGESTEMRKNWRMKGADENANFSLPISTTDGTTTVPSTSTIDASTTPTVGSTITTVTNTSIQVTTVEGSGEYSGEENEEEESGEGNSVENSEEEYEEEDEEDAISQATNGTTTTIQMLTTTTRPFKNKKKSKNGTVYIPEAEEEEQIVNIAQLQLDGTPTPGDISLTTSPPNAHTIFNVNTNANSNSNPNLSSVITPVNTIIDGIGPLILPLIGYSRQALDAYANRGFQPGILGGAAAQKVDGVSIYRPDSNQFQPIAVPRTLSGGQTLVQNTQPQPLPPIPETRYKPRQVVQAPIQQPIGDLKSAPLDSNKGDYYHPQVAPAQRAAPKVITPTKVTRRGELPQSSPEDSHYLKHSPTIGRTIFAPRRPGVNAAEVSGPHVRFLPDPPAAKSAAMEDVPTLEELGRILERTKQKQQRTKASAVEENAGFVQEVSGSEPPSIEKPYYPPQLDRIFQKIPREGTSERRPEPEKNMLESRPQEAIEQKAPENTAHTGSPKVGRQQVQSVFFEDSGIMVKETSAPPPVPFDLSQTQSPGFGVSGSGFGGGKQPSFIWK